MTFHDDWNVTLTVRFNGNQPTREVERWLVKRGATWEGRSGDWDDRVAWLRVHDLGHAEAYARALHYDSPSLSFYIEAQHGRDRDA